MRMRTLSAVLLLAVTVLLLPTGISARPAAAAASTAPATLFVAGLDVSGCSDSGPGTSAQPFCTISAAAAVVQPGQTVMVSFGTYDENLTITRSGTATAPIRFVATGGVTVTGAQNQPSLTVRNAAHVELQGLNVTHGAGAAGIVVDNSSQITIDRAMVNATGTGNPGIQVTGSSSAVTISRETIYAQASTAVQIDPGVSGAALTDDTVAPHPTGYPGIVATDAPDTTITGNTVVTICGHAIELDGNSGGTVENNILETANGLQRTACTTPGAGGTALTVSTGSAAQTTADYNLIDPASGGPLYSWAGTNYPTLAQFNAATGQGTHDLVSDPMLTNAVGIAGYSPWFPLQPGSPAIDSANASAPGETATDLLGHPREDDPSVPNTGTGPGYFDRGAVEFTDGLDPAVSVTLRADPSAGPLDVAVTLTVTPAPGSWPENVPPRVDVLYYFGNQGRYSRLTGVASGTIIRHTFQRAGTHTMQYTISTNDLREGSLIVGKASVVVGADYTPVAPLRLLDTRHRIGVATTTPVPAGGQVVLPITGTGGVPANDLTAVVANVTVTRPTGSGYITVYPDGQSRPLTSNLNFRAGQTVANLVTVPVVDGKVVLYNGSQGTVHLILDLEGYYSEAGRGYKPLAPVRVLDTRDGTGTTHAGPVAPHTSLLLSLGSRLPAGTTAAVLNLTATKPSASGYLTAYPAGSAVPNASNLNFTRGETVANLVVVPVVNGQAEIYNGSWGSTQMVADLEGFYGTAASGAVLTFVPYGPVRLVDTRTGTSGPLGSHKTMAVFPRFYSSCGGGCAPATAAVLNVTAVHPQAGGYLTVYPYGQPRPLTSNLNFTRGAIVPNLAMVGSEHGTAIYNASAGDVQIVVDEAGYFITPPS